MAEGELRRKLEELCQAYCNSCEETISDWVDYDEALGLFIEHRRRIHHSEATNSIGS